MPLFKKKDKGSKKQIKNNLSSKEVYNNQKHLTVKKKRKLGLGRKNKEKIDKKQQVKTDIAQTAVLNEVDIEDFQKETINTQEPIEKKEFSKEKKKTFIKKDLKNKPVYLEDTGEKLGFVFDTIYDKDKNIVGFKIKDEKSDAVLSFPLEQFDYTNEGVIFIPGWYTNSVKIIEKLEFKDKISPELTALISDDEVSNEELYDIFVKHDDEMVNYIDDAKSLRELLTNRLGVLERQRLALKDDLMDLTEKRLIKDIDRREFSEDVLKHRRKVNILDINISKCKDLIKRLDNTSFGLLGKENIIQKIGKNRNKTDLNIKNTFYEKILESSPLQKELKLENNMVKETDAYYKDKYFALKDQFEQLESEYQELKIAVDRLIEK
jgi:hypothetical protein